MIAHKTFNYVIPQRNRILIAGKGGISCLIKLLNTTHPDLLVNASIALGRCAEDRDNFKYIYEMDGIRLLWSLLKHPNNKVFQCKYKNPSCC